MCIIPIIETFCCLCATFGVFYYTLNVLEFKFCPALKGGEEVRIIYINFSAKTNLCICGQLFYTSSMNVIMT